ncbi:hypothetical protein QBC46DRAFT_397389 [Diplogelasinospora grovesii]|uniref:Cyclochlorotine biosynthesis protein O n=1 Tax=Diplogelasinospora grovesii TaxID=303347 RepID=A0AAN6MZM3_9PEZI|nr:hypothetical protein QBC46DRAFT_397389 [Diplogelasinospora grovesii]
MSFLMDMFNARAARRSEPIKYDRVKEDENDGSVSGSIDILSERSSLTRSLLVHRLLLVFQALAMGILAAYVVFGPRHPSDVACAQQLSPYSPYIESGDLEYVEFQAQNHLMQPSPYRGHPTREVEEAWLKLWRLPTIHFAEEKMVALNKTPADLYAKVAPKYGGDMMGFFDVFHQLHCLSLVRQYTYRNDYDYSNVTAFRAPEEVVRGHIDHCIETIRKAIMCTGDVTPVVFRKDDGRAEGFKSDFNIQRKCRNFTKIQEWAFEHRGYAQ